MKDVSLESMYLTYFDGPERPASILEPESNAVRVCKLQHVIDGCISTKFLYPFAHPTAEALVGKQLPYLCCDTIPTVHK